MKKTLVLIVAALTITNACAKSFSSNDLILLLAKKDYEQAVITAEQPLYDLDEKNATIIFQHVEQALADEKAAQEKAMIPERKALKKLWLPLTIIGIPFSSYFGGMALNALQPKLLYGLIALGNQIAEKKPWYIDDKKIQSTLNGFLEKEWVDLPLLGEIETTDIIECSSVMSATSLGMLTAYLAYRLGNLKGITYESSTMKQLLLIKNLIEDQLRS